MSQWVHAPFNIDAYVQQIAATNPVYNQANFNTWWENRRVLFRNRVSAHFAAGLRDPAVQASHHFTVNHPPLPGRNNRVWVGIKPAGHVVIKLHGIVYLPTNQLNSANRSARTFALAWTDGRAWFNQALQDLHIQNPNLEIDPLETKYGFDYNYTGNEWKDKIEFHFWNAPNYLDEQFVQQTGTRFAELQIAALANNNN